MEGLQIKNIYPLTPMQEGMLYHSLLNPNSPEYFQQMSLHIIGHVDHIVLKETMNKLIERYEALRTIFLYEDVEEPLQVALQKRDVELHVEDISHLGLDESRQYVHQFEALDREKGFDLSSDKLMRISLLHQGNDQYTMIWSFHHIIMDGWCIGIIVDDFFSIYQSLTLGSAPQLGPVYPYSNYIAWLEQQDKALAKGYWKSYLDGFEQISPVPKKRYNTKSFSAHENRTFEFSLDVPTHIIEDMSRQFGVTLSSVIQSVWGILLQHYNATDDVVFGTVVSGRPADVVGVEKMVGLFINTIPVRVKGEGTQTFKEVIQQVQHDLLQSNEHSFYPLADIQAETDHKSELIQSLVAFENYPIDEELRHSKKGLPFDIDNVKVFEQSSYGFNLSIVPGDVLTIRLNYSIIEYDTSFIEKIANHFNRVIRYGLDNPDIELRDICLLGQEEERQILIDFNQTSGDYPREQTLHALFHEQVEKYPDRVAVVFEGETLTYKELNRKANQVARVLRAQGVEPNDLVGIMADRSLEMIIGLVGVLKSGGAYVPIDPDYPEERISFILENSNSRYLLTQHHLLSKIKFSGVTLNLGSEELYSGPTENLDEVNQSSDLAYMMYTSGSTGQPKGTLTRHYNISRLVKNTNYIQLEADDCILQLSSFSFDGSTFDIFGALLNGARLVLLRKENLLDLKQLSDTIRQEGITVFFITTALFNALVEESIESLNNIRKVFFGGEKTSKYHVEKAIHYLGPNRVVNVYGPTESTVFALYEPINEWDDQVENVPIGRPISHTTALILDKNNHLSPIGVIGELCLGGEGLAKGYWQNESLTRERFIANPYQPEGVLYKTGDLARWLPDGRIEYWGRMDQQIKLRGFRIELDEIKQHLLRFDGVSEATVVVRNDKQEHSYLCAYFVFEETRKPSVSSLKESLAEKLPAYMLPAYYVQLDSLPLTANGKINGKALPEPEVSYAQLEQKSTPVSEWEQGLASIWEDVLGIEGVGQKDHFFDCGGHSLKATILASRINKHFNIEFPLRAIFEHATLQKMAAYIQELEGKSFLPIEPVEQREFYPVSPAQKRMYVVSQLDTMGISYNIPIVLHIKGELDLARLEKAFLLLLQRHEALRTSFEMLGEELVQKVHPVPDFKLNVIQGRATRSAVKDQIQPFDFTKAPLFRVGVIQESLQEHVLVLDMHHIISDGVSLNLLVKELSAFYKEETLPEVRLQYKDYTQWQYQNQSKVRDEQKHYWTNKFTGNIPVLDFPTDYVRPPVQTFEGRQIHFELGREGTARLKRSLQQDGVTLYMILLSAYSVLLMKYTGQEEMVVGSPVAGRRHTDTQEIIGLFVNTLALRLYPEKKLGFGDVLQAVKEEVIHAFEHQEYPLEELLDQLDIRRDLSRNPLFNTSFTLQNMEMTDWQLGGLEITPYDHGHSVSKFDFLLAANESDEKLLFSLEYNTQLFSRITMEQMSQHFLAILESVSNNPELKLAEINMLTDQESKYLVSQFNPEPIGFPEQAIHVLFEEQVRQRPAQEAIRFGQQ
ncbi:amino acid adenylation domain-containing protein, partial [Bacillus horti]